MTTDQKQYLRLLRATSDTICLLVLYVLFVPLIIHIQSLLSGMGTIDDCIYRSDIYIMLLPLFVLVPPGLSFKFNWYDQNTCQGIRHLFFQPLCFSFLAIFFFDALMLSFDLSQLNAITIALISGCILFSLLVLNRKYLTFLITKSRSNDNIVKHILIVGNGPKAQSFAKHTKTTPESGLRFAGFLGTSSPLPEKTKKEVIGKMTDLPKLVQNHYVDCVLFPEDPEIAPHFDVVFKTCSLLGIDFATTIPRQDTDLDGAARIQSEIMNDQKVTLYKFMNIRPFSAFIKRVFDFTGSSILIFLCIPFWIVIPLLIKSSSPGPIFFRQERVGKFGKKFTLYKFRSMYENAEKMQESLMYLNEMDGPAFKIKNDPRQTPTGKILRKYSLDELPQLFNVFKGDISLVGPRPAKADEVLQYRPLERRRLAVTQGITCIWQISGRNDIKFDEWMKLDLMYIDSWSSVQDFKILFKTIPAVLMKKGAY